MSSWIWGRHAVLSAVEAGTVEEVWLADGSGVARKLLSELEEAGIRVKIVPRHRIDALAPSGSNGIAARIQSTKAKAEDLEQLMTVGEVGRRRLMALDQVEDPRNLGAVVRVAAGLGFGGVVIPRDHAASLDGAARKAAAGAADRLPVIAVTNFRRALDQLRVAGFWIYGAEVGGESCQKVDLSGDVVLVLGSEGSGLRRLTQEACDKLIGIPLASGIESLNVSTAAAILGWEVVRKDVLGPRGT